MLSMASRIWRPRRRVVLMLKVPRLILRLRSARLRPCKKDPISHTKKKRASFIYLKKNKIPLSASIHTNLQLHHHIVEAIIAAASHKATHVILTWCEKEDVTVSGYFEKRRG